MTTMSLETDPTPEADRNLIMAMIMMTMVLMLTMMIKITLVTMMIMVTVLTMKIMLTMMVTMEDTDPAPGAGRHRGCAEQQDQDLGLRS